MASSRAGTSAIAQDAKPLTLSSQAHALQLAPDSPFVLVGEAAQAPYLYALGGAAVLTGGSCSSSGTNEYASRFRTVGGAQVRRLSRPPIPTDANVTASWVDGHDENDLWFRAHFDRPGAPDESLLLHNDGSAWRVVPSSGSGVEALYPLDWYDGARLVAQRRAPGYSGVTSVEPFLVWGKTSHAPPDLSSLDFPEPTRDYQLTSVSYAALHSHELFAAYTIHDAGHDGLASAAVGRTTATGRMLVEVVASTRGRLLGTSLTVGHLGQRAALIAWGNIESDGAQPWLRLYDSTSSTPIPSLGAPSDGYLSDVWFGGNRIWAKRGNTLWCFDGSTWSRVIQLDQGALVEHAPDDGSVWIAALNGELTRLDGDSRAHRVPFLAASAHSLTVTQLLAVSADDIWLTARDGSQNALLFRTQPTHPALSCD